MQLVLKEYTKRYPGSFSKEKKIEINKGQLFTNIQNPNPTKDATQNGFVSLFHRPVYTFQSPPISLSIITQKFAKARSLHTIFIQPLAQIYLHAWRAYRYKNGLIRCTPKRESPMLHISLATPHAAVNNSEFAPLYQTKSNS